MRFSPITQKILLLLLGGAALAFSRSRGRNSRIIKATTKEWRRINREVLNNNIRKLYESKLIDYKEHDDGTVEIILNEEGTKRALRYDTDKMIIKRRGKWDNRWRVVLFDIPEEQKNLRDSLRTKMKQIGLVELQKSVFVHPFECRKEIDFLIEIYDARRYVRFIEANYIDNQLHLKKKFKLV